MEELPLISQVNVEKAAAIFSILIPTASLSHVGDRVVFEKIVELILYTDECMKRREINTNLGVANPDL